MSSSLEKQFQEIMKEFVGKTNEVLQVALVKGAEKVKSSLEINSPVDANSTTLPHFKDSWEIKTKYTNVKYVGNTKRNANGIPLSNLIEYGSKGKPFIQKTFDSVKNDVYNTVVDEMKKI